MPMGTMAMMGTPYGSDIGIRPGSMPPKLAPGSCPEGGGWCACCGAGVGDGGAPSCGGTVGSGALAVCEAAGAGTDSGGAAEAAAAAAAGAGPGCNPLVLAPLPALRRSS